MALSKILKLLLDGFVVVLTWAGTPVAPLVIGGAVVAVGGVAAFRNRELFGRSRSVGCQRSLRIIRRLFCWGSSQTRRACSYMQRCFACCTDRCLGRDCSLLQSQVKQKTSTDESDLSKNSSCEQNHVLKQRVSCLFGRSYVFVGCGARRRLHSAANATEKILFFCLFSLNARGGCD